MAANNSPIIVNLDAKGRDLEILEMHYGMNLGSLRTLVRILGVDRLCSFVQFSERKLADHFGMTRSEIEASIQLSMLGVTASL